MEKSIIIVGLYDFKNLGDPLYMDTTRKIIREFCSNPIKMVDIWGGSSEIGSGKRRSNNRFLRYLRHFYLKVRNKVDPIHDYKQYFYRAFQDGLLVLIPGGGFISFSRTHPFHGIFAAIEWACKKRKISLYINAVGICRDVDRLSYEKQWKKILSSDQLAYFTCRDGEKTLERLTGRKVSRVVCTACLSNELYGVEKKTDSRTIGIGVIRGNAFSMYGYGLDENGLIEFYANLIDRIERETDCEAALFTNGLPADVEIARKIEGRIHKNLLVPTPKSPEELVSTISGFKAVVCARMHAAIISFSLDIPTVLLCWGVKGQEWMDLAGAPQFAIDPGHMSPEYVFDKLQSALQGGWPPEKRKELQVSARKSIKDLLDHASDSVRIDWVKNTGNTAS